MPKSYFFKAALVPRLGDYFQFDDRKPALMPGAFEPNAIAPPLTEWSESERSLAAARGVSLGQSWRMP